MADFKPGDRVYYMDSSTSQIKVWGTFKYTSNHPEPNAVWANWDESGNCGWMPGHRIFKGPTPEEEAIKLLEKAGYTVLVPTPKLTGTVTIYTSIIYPNTIFATTSDELDGSSRVIAKISWTEGEGLDNG